MENNKNVNNRSNNVNKNNTNNKTNNNNKNTNITNKNGSSKNRNGIPNYKNGVQNNKNTLNNKSNNLNNSNTKNNNLNTKNNNSNSKNNNPNNKNNKKIPSKNNLNKEKNININQNNKNINNINTQKNNKNNVNNHKHSKNNNNNNQKNSNKISDSTRSKNNVPNNSNTNKVNNQKKSNVKNEENTNKQKKLQPYKPQKTNENVNNIVKNTNKQQEKNKDIQENQEKTKTKWPIIIVLFLIVIILIILSFFIINLFGKKINSNVYIEDINVSKLGSIEANEKIKHEYSKILGTDIKYLYKDQEYNINLNDIQFEVLVEDAVDEAQSIGRKQNIFYAAKEYYELKLGNTKNINLNFKYDKEKLYSKIKEIENNFYKEVSQYTYEIQDNKLKIVNGSAGVQVKYEELENELLTAIKTRNMPEFFNIPVKIEEPEEIDVEKIHSEVFVKVANAYYDTKPFKIHNEVKGVDFNRNQLLEMIEENPENNEYIIDLIITEPEITVDGLGLYNDVLGQCKTAYANNPNRTINLRLAANKINGKILMPGESFSYNDIVGERTVAAGYRNAAIYVNGEVEDGLAGGICQISSTIYDAVVYANLQIDERFNHARVPSYVTAGRDATVYWGSKDFKFTNNRDYPIKISVTVNGGYATATIYGMKTDNEYDISFASSVVSRYNGYMVVKTYKVYKQNGVEVKRELLSTDSYKI